MSLGNIPWYHSACMGSSVSNLTLSSLIPMASAISWTKILMKMREDEVVSSSLRRMMPRHDHGRESV